MLYGPARLRRQHPARDGLCDRGAPCADHGTNFVYVHTAPDATSPLAPDVGLHPGRVAVDDRGRRHRCPARGRPTVVAFARSGDWVGVWYLGDPGGSTRPRAPGAGTAAARTVAGAGVDSAPSTAARTRSSPRTRARFRTSGDAAAVLNAAGQSYVLADASCRPTTTTRRRSPTVPYERTDSAGTTATTRSTSVIGSVSSGRRTCGSGSRRESGDRQHGGAGQRQQLGVRRAEHGVRWPAEAHTSSYAARAGSR